MSVRCNFCPFLFYFTSVASGSLSQGSVGLPRKPNISTANQKSTTPRTHLLFIYDFLLFSKSVQKSNISLSSHLSCVFSAVSTSHTWLNRNTLWMNQDNWAFSKANSLVSLSACWRKFTSRGLVSLKD